MSIRTLKIKIKSLAAEATIIRREERKVLGSARWMQTRDRKTLANDLCEQYREYDSYESLHNHRVGDVRQEARASQLAYAFIRGKQLANVECMLHHSRLRRQPQWAAVFKIAARFYDGDLAFEDLRFHFEAWIKRALGEDRTGLGISFFEIKRVKEPVRPGE